MTPEPPVKPGAKGPLQVLAILLTLAFVLIYAVNGLMRPPRASAVKGSVPAYRAEGSKVVLFGTATCPYCKAMREYFAFRKVNFQDLDVDHNTAAEKEWRALGGRGVPVVLVDRKVIHGLDTDRIEVALKEGGFVK